MFNIIDVNGSDQTVFNILNTYVGLQKSVQCEGIETRPLEASVMAKKAAIAGESGSRPNLCY